MKELLYIPNGEYITFIEYNDRYGVDMVLVSYDKVLEKYPEYTIEHLIKRCKTRCLSPSFYKRNHLPEPEHLTIEQFEIIEVEDK